MFRVQSCENTFSPGYFRFVVHIEFVSLHAMDADLSNSNAFETNTTVSVALGAEHRVRMAVISRDTVT